MEDQNWKQKYAGYLNVPRSGEDTEGKKRTRGGIW